MVSQWTYIVLTFPKLAEYATTVTQLKQSIETVVCGKFPQIIQSYHIQSPL